MSSPDTELALTLAPHPLHPCRAVRRIDARVRRSAERLFLTYSAEADWNQVRLPPPGALRRAEALWRHTCFELFLRPSSGAGYQEFNFAPSLAWSCYHFSGYRRDMSVRVDEPAPTLSVEHEDRRLTVRASVCPMDLGHQATATRLAVAAVIELVSGELCYWALKHATGPPDFHHADNFAVEI